MTDLTPTATRTRSRALLPRILLMIAVLVTSVVTIAGPASARVLDGWHQLMNRQTAECLDVTGAAGWNGAEVKIWRCVGQANQKWQKIPVPNTPFYQLQVEHTGKCLARQGPAEPNVNLVQDVCSVTDQGQIWQTKPAPDGFSKIVALNRYVDRGGLAHDLCLDKAWGDVTVYPCHDGRWQQWQSLG